MTLTDPSCQLSPRHDIVLAARALAAQAGTSQRSDLEPIRLRRPPTVP
jgi:hypothetical protein